MLIIMQQPIMVAGDAFILPIISFIFAMCSVISGVVGFSPSFMAGGVAGGDLSRNTFSRGRQENRRRGDETSDSGQSKFDFHHHFSPGTNFAACSRVAKTPHGTADNLNRAFQFTAGESHRLQGVCGPSMAPAIAADTGLAPRQSVERDTLKHRFVTGNNLAGAIFS